MRVLIRDGDNLENCIPEVIAKNQVKYFSRNPKYVKESSGFIPPPQRQCADKLTGEGDGCKMKNFHGWI